jgi:hypothetical protein
MVEVEIDGGEGGNNSFASSACRRLSSSSTSSMGLIAAFAPNSAVRGGIEEVG